MVIVALLPMLAVSSGPEHDLEEAQSGYGSSRFRPHASPAQLYWPGAGDSCHGDPGPKRWESGAMKNGLPFGIRSAGGRWPVCGCSARPRLRDGFDPLVQTYLPLDAADHGRGCRDRNRPGVVGPPTAVACATSCGVSMTIVWCLGGDFLRDGLVGHAAVWRPVHDALSLLMQIYLPRDAALPSRGRGDWNRWDVAGARGRGGHGVCGMLAPHGDQAGLHPRAEVPLRARRLPRGVARSTKQLHWPRDGDPGRPRQRDQKRWRNVSRSYTRTAVNVSSARCWTYGGHCEWPHWQDEFDTLAQTYPLDEAACLGRGCRVGNRHGMVDLPRVAAVTMMHDDLLYDNWCYESCVLFRDWFDRAAAWLPMLEPVGRG